MRGEFLSKYTIYYIYISVMYLLFQVKWNVAKKSWKDWGNVSHSIGSKITKTRLEILINLMKGRISHIRVKL